MSAIGTNNFSKSSFIKSKLLEAIIVVDFFFQAQMQQESIPVGCLPTAALDVTIAGGGLPNPPRIDPNWMQIPLDADPLWSCDL